MVPTLTWALVHSNFPFAISNSPKSKSCVVVYRLHRVAVSPRTGDRAAPDRRPDKAQIRGGFSLCARGHDGFRHIARRFALMLEFHRVGGAPLRHRTQRGRVAEHFGQRPFGLDGLAATDHVVHAWHHATA